jgi:hypothetical protein
VHSTALHCTAAALSRGNPREPARSWLLLPPCDPLGTRGHKMPPAPEINILTKFATN